MKRTGFLYDDRYLLHETGPYHPENPDRLKAVYKGIEEAGLIPMLTRIHASRADVKWVETVHDKNYIARFGDACVAGAKVFEYPDNQMCAQTFDIALLAIGGILDAAKMILTGEIDNAFCAVRPPGHHAERGEAVGFCYFNNAAVVARYMQIEWGVKKVAIIDFDVHHGNGTQHIFEEDPSVFYYSIHEHPSFSFPGTGRAFEKGVGKGVGYTLNNPVLPGKGDEDYKDFFEKELIPAINSFHPEILIVSAGFDAYKDDEMSGIELTDEGYSWIMQRIVETAAIHTEGKILSVLEGGYSLKDLPRLAADHVRILLNA